MFQFFTKKKSRREAAEALYRTAELQARIPAFYTRFGVPDTVDGRFDLLSLHAFLVIGRLTAEGPKGLKIAQDFFDVMFRAMEQANRQAGVGDLSVPKHQKRMMRGLNGRSAAYAEVIGSPDALADTLKRNLYAGRETVDNKAVQAMVFYMSTARKYLAAQSFDNLAAGTINFPALDTDSTQNDHARMVS